LTSRDIGKSDFLKGIQVAWRSQLCRMEVAWRSQPPEPAGASGVGMIWQQFNVCRVFCR